jgi:hypothetical protein
METVAFVLIIIIAIVMLVILVAAWITDNLD